MGATVRFEMNNVTIEPIGTSSIKYTRYRKKLLLHGTLAKNQSFPAK